MSKENQNEQVYHHKINKGGLDDILSQQRLVSTEARVAAGGAEGVRAHQGPCPPSDFDAAEAAQPGALNDERYRTTLEFKCNKQPDVVHPTNGQVRWNVPDQEYLDVQITKAHRGGLTVENPPGSKAELDAAFETKRQEAVATASRRPPEGEYAAARSQQQERAQQGATEKAAESREATKPEEKGQAKDPSPSRPQTR